VGTSASNSPFSGTLMPASASTCARCGVNSKKRAPIHGWRYSFYLRLQVAGDAHRRLSGWCRFGNGRGGCGRQQGRRWRRCHGRCPRDSQAAHRKYHCHQGEQPKAESLAHSHSPTKISDSRSKRTHTVAWTNAVSFLNIRILCAETSDVRVIPTTILAACYRAVFCAVCQAKRGHRAKSMSSKSEVQIQSS